MNDARWMRLALELAELGVGDVAPNPLVGAVVVRDGRAVGRGYHRGFGGPHAEVFALDEAGDDALAATLYVTLEPCSHQGKTPPCTDRIIAAEVARVVVAVRDPNPQVDGQGISALRAAGIEVDEGEGANEARRQNEVFFKYMQTGRPFVHLKLATSLDGRIAARTGDAKWISGEASRVAAHRLRRRHSAILVGIGTVLADDPELTVRHVIGRDPVPVVLDRSGRISPDARLFARPQHPIIVTGEIPQATEEALTAVGGRVWRMPAHAGGGGFDLEALCARLAEEGIDSLLVEGGGETAASFIESGLVDKVSFFVAPILIGGRNAVPAIGGVGVDRISEAWRLKDLTVERLGDDLCVTGYPNRLPATPGA